MSYISPALSRIGSIADVTKADDLAWNFDGIIFHGKSTGPGPGDGDPVGSG